MYSLETGFTAVNPSSLLDDALMLEYYDRDTTLGSIEQLYTARGSQGFGTAKEITQFGVYPSDYTDVALLLYDESEQPINY